MPPQPPRAGIVSFFRLLGLLKYGLALSMLLAYLPFTTYRIMPRHGMLGNLFSVLRPLSAFSAMLFAFIVAYFLLILAAAPAAILAPDDPPLRGRWPAATWFWAWLGRTPFRSFAGFAQWFCSRVARALRMTYILDRAGHIYPAHLTAA